MKRIFGICLFLLCATFVFSNSIEAQITVSNTATCRLVTEPSGNRDDNNGGGDGSTLIGLNTGMVDNFLVYQMDLSPLAGMQTSGATVTVGVNPNFTNANHGQATDLIVLNAAYSSNSGFDSGNGQISGTDNQAADGSISFLNLIQTLSAATTEPWLDETGNSVANLGEAIVQIATTPGYDEGFGPLTIEFTLDQATAQTLIDDGIAAFVMSTIDDGDSRSRFFLLGGMEAVSITFEEADTMGGTVPPAEHTVFRGIELSGAITDFQDSDDVRALYNPGFIIINTEAPVWLIFDAVAPSGTEFFVESQAGTPGLTYTVEAFDFTTSAFVEIGQVAETFGADTVESFPIAPNNIDVGGEVRTRVGWRLTGFVINFPWEVRVDQVGWTN